MHLAKKLTLTLHYTLTRIYLTLHTILAGSPLLNASNPSTLTIIHKHLNYWASALTNILTLTTTLQLSNKLSKANFFLNRVKHTPSPRALKSLYLSFFHSHLLYCATIYTHAPLKATSPIYSNNRKNLLGTSLEHNI